LPGPANVGLIAQFMLLPAGKTSVSVAPVTGPAALSEMVIVNPIGLPGATVAAKGVSVMVSAPTPAALGGNATITSLNCLVRAMIAESTFFAALKDVVMSNSNWQNNGGLVATGGLPTNIGVLQSVPKGAVGVTA